MDGLAWYKAHELPNETRNIILIGGIASANEIYARGDAPAVLAALDAVFAARNNSAAEAAALGVPDRLAVAYHQTPLEDKDLLKEAHAARHAVTPLAVPDVQPPLACQLERCGSLTCPP